MVLARFAAVMIGMLVLGGCGQGGGAGAGTSGSAAVSESPGAVSAPGRGGAAEFTTSAPAPAPLPPTPRPTPPELQTITMLVQRGRLGDARIQAERYLEGHPDDAQATFLLGLVYHRAKAHGKAEPLMVRALSLDPDYHVVNHFLGWCRFYLGDIDGARIAFKAHLETNPNESDSHFGLGLTQLEDGRLDEAEDSIRRAIAVIDGLADTNPSLHARRKLDLGKCNARLGDIAFQRGDLDTARALYHRAVEIDPNQYAVYFALSRIERRLGNVREADKLEQLHRQIVADRARAQGAEPPPEGDEGETP